MRSAESGSSSSCLYCSILALPSSLLATEQSRLVSVKHMVCLLHFLSSYSGFMLYLCWASLVAQLVKNLPAVQETWVRSLGWEDPLERERLPTPVFWPGEFLGLYNLWGHKKSGTTEQISLHSVGIRSGTSLYYSCLEISMDRGTWRATVHGVTKSRTRLSP